MTTTNQVAPTAHSHSRMQSYSECPLSYRLSYIDRVGTDDSAALEIGAAAHEFFERFIKGARYFYNTEGKTFEAHVLALAAECFQKSPRDQSNFKEYLEICQTFAKAYKPDPDYPRVLAEQQIALDRNWQKCGWFDKDVMFRAKIDLMELPVEDPVRKIRIRDWKTGYSGAIDSFQLDIYSLAASILYPELEQVQVEFYYVKSGFRQVKVLEVKDLGITKVQLEALIARMESDSQWKAKPGARCLNCHVAAFCDQKPSNLVAIAKIDQAQTLATEIAFLEAQVKAKKKPLKAWCEKEGPVEAGGLVYSNYPTESLKIEIAPLLSLCVKHEVDPSVILNPDSTALRKVFKQNPAFAEALAPYSAVETATRFYGKKAAGQG